MAKQHNLTGQQFMFSIASFIQASSLITFFIYPYAKQEAWLVLLISGAASILLALLYAQLMKDYHPLGFFDMLEKAFGKGLGIALKGLYVLFFMTLTAANLRFMADFFIETVLEKTPIHVVIGCCALICLWAASYDANISTRYDSASIFVFIAFIATSLIMLRPQADLSGLLPVFTLTAKEYLQSAHISVAIFIGESVCLLYLSRYVIPSPKRSPRFYWILGFVIGILSLILIVFQDIITLGRMARLFTIPLYETLRAIMIAPYFSHMEILFIFFMSMLFINKIVTLFFVSIDSFRNLFRQPKRSRFSLLVCAGIVLLAYIFVPSMQHLIYYVANTIVFLWTPFTIIIPVLLLVTLKIRAIVQKRTVQPA